MADISGLSFFEGLGGEELTRIGEQLTERNYRKNSTVVREGQESDGLYVVARGLVRVYRLHDDGRERTVALLGPGEVLGEMTLFGGELRSASAETPEGATLLFLPRASIPNLLLEVPKLAMRIIDVLSARLRESNQRVQELTFMNSRGRVICNLCRLVEAHGDGEGEEACLPLTHAEIAKISGVSRETASKVLSQLSDIGLVRLGNRKLWVLHLDKLYQQLE